MKVFFFFFVCFVDDFVCSLCYLVLVAHMWFGNLVTMDWWNEIWLNEGFASYNGWIAMQALFPDWNIEFSMYESEISNALKHDALPDTHAVQIARDVQTREDVGLLFDDITYSKGFACVVLLARHIG
jgi:aminopeptidase N